MSYGLKIVHYTHKDNLPKILESGMIFDQLRRNKKNIRVGEGDLNRKCCYPTNSYTKRPPKCTEGCGLYFRVVKPGQKIQRPFINNVAMVFDGAVLSRYKWHINFCENNGLWIDDGIAHFGSEDVCVNSSNKLADVLNTDFDQLDAEIIIYDSIDLRNLVSVLDRNMKDVPFSVKNSASVSVRRSKSKSRRMKSLSYVRNTHKSNQSRRKSTSR